MRWRLVLVFLTILPASLSAQSTTADGVKAMARGDGAAAYRIFKPLADAPDPDPVAQFFLAALYDTGMGVRMDSIRACALYLKTSAGSGPYAPQAFALAEVLQQTDRRMRDLCRSHDFTAYPDSAIPSAAAPPPDTGADEGRHPEDDGIEAFVAGDFQRAANLLRPIAERWPGPVHSAANVLMAMLYENGLGLPRDATRACGLNVRTTADYTNPFGRLGEAMVRVFSFSVSSEQMGTCLLLARLGFEHHFEPATFVLGPAHSIALELSGEKQSIVARISYQNTQKETDVNTAFDAGSVFLPIEHKELATGRSVPERRHFIEVCSWRYDQTALEWQLLWSLSEVVREDLEPVTTETIATAAGAEPPARDVDLRRLVSLGVNSAGEAEWAILTGPNARRAAIETDRERQEVRALQEARKAANDRVEWRKLLDANRQPTFNYVDAEGCGNAFVFGWSSDRGEAIAINANRSMLQLATVPRIFDIAAFQKALQISVEILDRPESHFPFCTDHFSTAEGSQRRTWKAVAGSVTIQVSPPGVRAQQPEAYRIFLQLDNLELVSPAGERVRAPGSIRLSAIAGGWASQY